MPQRHITHKKSPHPRWMRASSYRCIVAILITQPLPLRQQQEPQQQEPQGP